MDNNSNMVPINDDNELVKIEQFDIENLDKDFIKIGKANMLLSQIPSAVSIHQASSYYKVVFPPGSTGKLIKYKNGLRGTPLVNGSNKIVSGPHAGLQKVSGLISPMLIFTALSMLTGQYFLAEINSSIQSVIREIEEIKDIILLKEESLLFACSSSLKRITANYPQIAESNLRKTATLVTLQNDINQLSSSIYFYSYQIINLFSKIERSLFEKKVSAADLKKELTELAQKMLTAMNLRKMFVVLEFALSASFDPITIKQTIENISEENKVLFSPIIKEIGETKHLISKQIIQKAKNQRNQKDIDVIFGCFDDLEEKINSRLIPTYVDDVEQALLKLSNTYDKELEYIIAEDEVYMRKTA